LERGEGGFDDHQAMAMEEAVVVAARALHCHLAEDVKDVVESTAAPPSPSPALMLEPKPVDGFEFGMTLYNDMDMDTLRLPRQFASVVDDQRSRSCYRCTVVRLTCGPWRCSSTALV
jgi:hypothetical protein